MAKVISIEKSVQHNNGDSWELDNYPPFAQTDEAEEWLGVSEISLERAKELAYELAGDEAYDYQEDIEEASDLYELQSVLDNFKYYQRDNTYNSSWWGGVVDYGVLTEDGEGYGTGLVLLRMHRGGDPRGNYYEMKAFELDSFIEEFPPYLSRLTYYIKTDEGDLTLDTEDSEGYTLLVVEDETGTFEQDDYVKIDEVEEAFDMDGNSFFSFGGGVAVGGLLGAYIGYKVGRAVGTRKGGTFDTEKKIGRSIKGAFTKKKYAGGGYTRSGVYVNGKASIHKHPKGYWMIIDELGYQIGDNFQTEQDAYNFVDIEGIKTKKKYAGGGGIESITRLNGNRQEYTLPLPKVAIRVKELNENALKWIKDNTGLEFKKTAWWYEAQPHKSEQIVKLITMYHFVTEFQNNATNKNILLLKFFKEDFFKYTEGGSVEDEIANIDDRIYNIRQLMQVANEEDIPYYESVIERMEEEKRDLQNPSQKKKRWGFFNEGGGVHGNELPYPYQTQWENLLRDFGTHYVMLMFPSGANGYYDSRTKGNYSDDAIRQSLKSMNSSKLSQGGGIDDLVKG